MRHFYFRLILGIFALLYIFLGGVFLYSAYSIWKKEKDNRR